MKIFQIILLILALLPATRVSAQNITATNAASALDLLQMNALWKIDDEVQENAFAFADAKNIQNSLVWSEWFQPFLDIGLSVLDGLMAVGDLLCPLRERRALLFNCARFFNSLAA